MTWYSCRQLGTRHLAHDLVQMQAGRRWGMLYVMERRQERACVPWSTGR